MSVGRILRYAGFGEEGTYGVRVEPVFHLDISGSTLDAPADSEILFEGGMGRSTYIKRPGFYAPEGNVVFPVDVRTILYFLKWALGGYSFIGGDSGNPEEFTHNLWAQELALLPSFTTRIGKDHFEQVFGGCVLNSLGLEIGDGLITATLNAIAQRDYKGTLQDIDDLLLQDEYPLAFHEAGIKMCTVEDYVSDPGNLADITAKLRNWDMNIENNASADGGRTVGSRHPRRVPVQEFVSTASGEMFFEDMSQLEKLWGATEGPSQCADGSTEMVAEITLHSTPCGGNQDYGNVVIFLPRVFFTSVQQQPSGRSMLMQPFNLRSMLGKVELDEKTGTAWQAAEDYRINDHVTNNADDYYCKRAHTSSGAGSPGNEPGVGADWETYWSESLIEVSTSMFVKIENLVDSIVDPATPE